MLLDMTFRIGTLKNSIEAEHVMITVNIPLPGINVSFNNNEKRTTAIIVPIISFFLFMINFVFMVGLIKNISSVDVVRRVCLAKILKIFINKSIVFRELSWILKDCILIFVKKMLEGVNICQILHCS